MKVDCHADKSARNDKKEVDCHDSATAESRNDSKNATSKNADSSDNAPFPALRSPLGLKQSIKTKHKTRILV